MSRKKHRIPASVRAAVLERDGGRCRMCGTHVDLTLHHVMYRSEGGANVAENLLTLCKIHHRRVHGDRARYQPICMDLVKALSAVDLATAELTEAAKDEEGAA